MNSNEKDLDNIRNKITIALVVLEKLSEGKSVTNKAISLAYKNLCAATQILDNYQDHSLET